MTAHWKKYATTNTDDAVDDFGAWFRDHHPTADFDEDIAATLAVEWLGTGPAFAGFSCSPHRVRTTTSALDDVYEGEVVSAIHALLPAWITWCAEKTVLSAALTERSLAEARHAATVTRAIPDLGQPAVARIAE